MRRERWLKGFVLSIALPLMLLSNFFISHGDFKRWLDLGEIILLVLVILRFSGYSREELGLGGEFSPLRHVVFPFVFFILPLGLLFFAPHRELSPFTFLLYLINYLITAGLTEELIFRGLLFASLEERFGGPVALVGNSVIHWLLHFLTGINLFQLMASLMLSSYRLTFRRIEPLIIVHGLWDAAFIALKPELRGFSALLLLMAIYGGALLSLVVYFAGEVRRKENGVIQ